VARATLLALRKLRLPEEELARRKGLKVIPAVAPSQGVQEAVTSV